MWGPALFFFSNSFLLFFSTHLNKHNILFLSNFFLFNFFPPKFYSIKHDDRVFIDRVFMVEWYLILTASTQSVRGLMWQPHNCGFRSFDYVVGQWKHLNWRISEDYELLGTFDKRLGLRQPRIQKLQFVITKLAYKYIFKINI